MLSWMERPTVSTAARIHACEYTFNGLTIPSFFFDEIDPLESEETLLLSLDMFANIARTKYTESGHIIVSQFTDSLLKYRELIQRASALSGTTSAPVGASDVKESLMVLEMQLTWMVYIMASCIGARVVRKYQKYVLY